MLKLSTLLCSLAVSFGLAASLFAQDTTPPVAALTAPADGSYLNSLPAITGTAADDSGVSGVQLAIERQGDGYFWDGGAFISTESWLSASFTDPAWLYASVPAWAGGETYTVIARSSDTAANLSVVYSTAVFHFDTGLPVSAITTPADGSFPVYFSGAAGTAWDAGSPVAQVKVRLARLTDNKYWDEGASQWTAAETWNLAVGTGAWNWSGPPQAGLISGTTYFAVSRAYDLAGNIQVSEIAGSSFVYSGLPLPPGCAQAVSVKNSGLGDYTFIQDALAAMPKNLTGDTCVIVTNDGSYTEAVRVEGFNNNGHRLKIMAVPGTTVTVSPPPASTAGFLLFNSSVTLAGMEVIPGGAIPYGILASSDSVTLSSVSVVSAGSIGTAGIAISSGSEVSDSSVTVEDAHGILAAGGGNTIARVSAANASGLYNALYLDAASDNTVSGGNFLNDEGRAVGLQNGASRNTISHSTITSNGPASAALYVSGSSLNVFTDDLIRNPSAGYGAYFTGGSDNNTVGASTVVAGGIGYYGLYFSGSSSNTVTGSYLADQSGYGAFITSGSANNLIAQSSIVGGSLSYAALYFGAVSSNTVTGSFISNPAGRGAYLVIGADHNTISNSTITAGAVYPALQLQGASFSVVADSYLQSASTAAYISGSTGTAISGSALVNVGGAGAGLYVCDGSRDLSLASSTIAGGTQGPAISLGAGNSGSFNIYSSSITGGANGLAISGQDAGASLNISGITFRSLAPGAAAVKFTGGAPVSTFTGFGFDDPAIGFSVDGGLLEPGARVTMRDASGARYGTVTEYDPGGYVDWVPDYIPPSLSSAAFSGLETSSLTVNWGTDFGAGTTYYVRLAGQAAPAPYLYSGSASAASLLFSGLTPDTLYYGFVSTAPASGFLASGSGRTLAAAPASASFSGVGYSSASLTWATGGNPAWTVYEYEISVSTTFAVPISSASGAVADVMVTGLSQGATYYGRVRAVNADGAPSDYVYAGAPAVTAVLMPAGAVTGLSGAALGTASINWTWNSGAVSAADYYALYTGPGVLLATAPFSVSSSFTQAGLGANTAHVLRVAGGNGNGEGPLSVSATVYTLAQAPSVPAAAQVALSSAVISLGLNGNSGGTALQLWRSADSLSYASLYEGPGLAYQDPGLAECSPYYYKARARNGAGLYSGFSGVLSFTTLASTPAAPGGLYAEARDGAQIDLVWEPSPSASVSAYNVYYDSASGTVNYAAPLAVLSSTATSWTTPELTAGSTYKFAVRASGACGAEDQNTALLASAQAVNLLSGVRAAIKVPQTGKRIKGNMVTIAAEVVLGRPSQVGRVLFQYSPAGTGAWADIPAANANHPNPSASAPYFVHMDAGALTAGAYDLRAVAYDVYNAADPAPPAVTVVVGASDYDINETVVAGEQSKEQKINNAVTSTVQAADDTTALVTKVVIPSGAVTDSTASITLVNNPASVPAPPAGADPLNLALKVNLSNGQSRLASGKAAVLSFNYRDDDGNGILDGTLATVDRLRVYTVADSGGAWTPLDTSVDKEKRTITASTTHFSFFSVFASAVSGLGAVKVYPVPWQPGAGGRFDSAQGVTFSGLPASARIKIFTITGELVRLLEVSAADGGFKLWDGRNSEGHNAASGVYLAVVKSGSDERTVKVAVER